MTLSEWFWFNWVSVFNAEVEFLDFKASEISAAAAIAISFSGEAEAVHAEKALSSLIHVKQVSL